MTPAIGLGLAFNLLAISILLIMIFVPKLTQNIKYRKFLIATTAIYLSGTALITVLLFIFISIGIQFALISEICILFIYIFDSYMIIRIGKDYEALKKAGEERREEEKS